MGQGFAAFALTLGLQAPAEAPRTAGDAAEDATRSTVEGSAAGAETRAARERPLYRAVLDQCARLSSSNDQAAAMAQLESWLEAWRESAFGLDDTLDTDRTLASATALAALAFRREPAEELLLLLADIAARLDDLARPAPDLALALAQGWLALLTVPLAEEIPMEERVEGLQVALRAAEAIDGEDKRDAFGCRLANELNRHLRAARRGREAAEMLEHALACFPTDSESRPYLLAALADERRADGDFERAWASLALADEASDLLRSRAAKGELAVLDRTLAGVRCQLELATGLIDRAALSLEQERSAVEAGARDPESRLDLLLNASGVALASARPYSLRQALAELESAAGAASSFAAQPGYRAQLRARAALIQEMLEELEPGSETRAGTLLGAAFADADLDETHRAAVGLRLLALAFRKRDLQAAEECLAHFEERSTKGVERAPELTASLVAARARLALERSAGEEELRRHDAALKLEYGSFLKAFGALPARDGGLGYLTWRNRTLLLGTLVDLCLALEGEAGPERAIDLLLAEQALGSLARRLGCAPGSLAEVRRVLLPSGIGLLLYLPGWTSTHLFCVDATSLVHREIAWNYALESLPRELDGLLSSSPARLSERERQEQLGRLQGVARELSRRLLPDPVPERLRTWRGLYVVGSELLGGIPFECLAPANELALAYLPSLPVGLELARRAKARNESSEGGPESAGLELLLVAAPETAKGLESTYPRLVPFPFGDDERASLSASFERSLVLTGREAHWSRIQAELAAGTPRVLHFFLHGVSDPERELSGGLALAPCDADPAGLLWCEQLFETDFTSPSLVILSACGSARGPRRTGDDGLAQLGGAFLSRGALATVQAAGDIAFEPTLVLMERFTRELSQGAGPAEAMRLARSELAEQATFAHPFYACSLRVVGLGFEPIRRRAGR